MSAGRRRRSAPRAALGDLLSAAGPATAAQVRADPGSRRARRAGTGVFAEASSGGIAPSIGNGVTPASGLAGGLVGGLRRCWCRRRRSRGCTGRWRRRSGSRRRSRRARSRSPRRRGPFGPCVGVVGGAAVDRVVGPGEDRVVEAARQRPRLLQERDRLAGQLGEVRHRRAQVGDEPAQLGGLGEAAELAQQRRRRVERLPASVRTPGQRLAGEGAQRREGGVEAGEGGVAGVERVRQLLDRLLERRALRRRSCRSTIRRLVTRSCERRPRWRRGRGRRGRGCTISSERSCGFSPRSAWLTCDV